jgi:hypothetical protein
MSYSRPAGGLGPKGRPALGSGTYVPGPDFVANGSAEQAFGPFARAGGRARLDLAVLTTTAQEMIT